MTSILFDAVILDGRPSGSRSRLIHLVPELARRGHSVTVLHGPLLDADAKTALDGASLLEVFPVPGPGAARRLALQPLAYRRTLGSVFPEAVSAETFPMPKVQGLLALVHDLRLLQLDFAHRHLYRHALRDACRRAKRIHTDSKTVAQQLVDLVHVDPRRIDVVPIPVSIPDLARLAPVAGMEEPFVLLVGHDDPRKDLSLGSMVAAGLAERGIAVVHAGRASEAPAYNTGGTSVGIPPSGSEGSAETPVSALGIISDDRRDALFHHAVAVLVPSRLEGFSLVPLEGLAAGAWVVASAIPVHQEILGDAVSYFPPGDAKAALACIMQAIHANPTERAERSVRSRARAAEFSSARAADAFEDSLRTAGILK